MKYIIMSALLIIFLSLASYSQNNQKDYILVLSVELYTNTSFSIPCDKFATAFKNQLNAKTITQEDSVKTFSFFIHNVKYARHNREIDVRRKYLYEINNKDTVTICTDGQNIILNGKMIKKNKKFIDFLNSMVDQHF
jgi:hypothetical protein